MKRELMTDFEKDLAAVVSGAVFPVGSGPKRFIRDICGGHIVQLSERGRDYLAYIAHRFRRQYTLNAEQWAWVNERLASKFAAEQKKNCPDLSPSVR